MIRVSYQDHLPEGVIAEPLPCNHCVQMTPAWGLYAGLSELQEPTGWICGTCIADAAREVAAAAWANARLPASDWGSDLGLFLKAQRNSLLDSNRWTIFPDSPLSEASRAEFMAYFTVLNRMTVDCADPTTWVWPATPIPAYAD